MGLVEHGCQSLKPLFDQVRAEQRNETHRDPSQHFGVNVYAWFNDISGVGDFGRMTQKALDFAGIPTNRILLPELTRRHQIHQTFSQMTRVPKYYFNLFVANAAHTEEIMKLYPPTEFKKHYNIGFWAWELDHFPSKWLEYREIFDELWTTSDFVSSAILSSPGASIMQTSVTTMPMGLVPNSKNYRADRERFNFGKNTMVS